MATVGVHLPLLTGQTLTLKLYPRNSGSIANGASGDSLTESGTGYFTATVAESLTGIHRADVLQSSTLKYQGWVNMSNDPAYVDDPSQTVSVVSTVVGRYDDATATSVNIECKVGETGVAKSVTVEDSSGDPVDLTDWGAKVLVIERTDRTADVQVVPNASITVSGTSNQTFTFTPSSTVLANPGDFLWSLREDSSGEVIIDGRLTVSYSPLED